MEQRVNNTKHRQHNSPSQKNYHPLTNKQLKDQNIVILQIDINGIRNKIDELNKTHTHHPAGHHHNTRNKTHRKLNNKNTPLHHHTHRQRAQMWREAHHTDQGRHNFHKRKHTQGHQHTQHRTTTDQNTQRHQSSKHIVSTKRHDVTTLKHRGQRHAILHTPRVKHTRLNTHR